MAVRFVSTELMPDSTIPDHGAPEHRPAPRPLEPGERVELWTATTVPGPSVPEASADEDVDWDVRPARVTFVASGQVGLQTGGWNLAGGNDRAGCPVRIRRLDDEGIAEWEGTLGADRTAARARWKSTKESPIASAPEVTLVVTLSTGSPPGVLHQRRRSPRLPVGLTPVRIRPLPGPSGEVLPVARLTDLSEHGAGVVVDYPMPAGQPVALEFTLPGERTTFTVRGRVVEPAVPLHGEAHPQLDGLPGFRRGIEFLGTAAGREYRRLAESLARRLRLRP